MEPAAVRDDKQSSPGLAEEEDNLNGEDKTVFGG
jgi:hypothetical protein